MIQRNDTTHNSKFKTQSSELRRVSGLLVTGTDTGVGKTRICGFLAGYLHRHGVRVVTQKWVQTGCAEQAEDLLAQQELGAFDADPALAAWRNPYCFPLPASPHLAAEEAGREIESARITVAYRELAARHELVIVEGAGGLLVPLRRHLLLADLAGELGLSALLVVRNGLGCVNHALLTIEALRQRNMPLLGVIFNRITGEGDERILRDNPRIIAEISGVTVLGELPYGASAPDFAPIGEAFMARWQELIHV